MLGYRSLLVLAAVAAVLVISNSAADAKHRKLTCHSGTAIVQQGSLRIFGIPFRSKAEGTFFGTAVYACLPGGRPQGLGDVGADQGTDSTTIAGLSFDGSRYLSTDTIDDGEGGPDSTYGVTDLKGGRGGGFANGVSGFDVIPSFRVMADGRQLTSDDAIHLVSLHSQAGAGRLLSTAGADAEEVALNGTTAYWTEEPKGAPAVIRTQAFPANAKAGENIVLSSIDGLPALHSRCERRTGATIARSQEVRVFARGHSRFACRDDRTGVVALGTAVEPDAVRIVDDRWLLTIVPAAAGSTATVYDMKKLTTVTSVEATAPLDTWTLALNGTFAWIAGGALLAQPVSADRPTTLAPATDTPTALASADATVYWTVGGTPHRFAAP